MIPKNFLLTIAIVGIWLSSIGASTTTEIELPGLYKWVLVCDIDNTGGGEYVRQQTIVARTKVTKSTTVEELKRKVSGTKSEFSSKMSAGGTFKALSVSSSSKEGYSSHEELVNQMISTESNSYEFEKTETLQETITVRPGAKFVLYQLQFTAPGIFQTFPVTATNPKQVKVLLTFKVEVTPKQGIIPDGSIYALKSYHGTYLCAYEGGENFPYLQKTANLFGTNVALQKLDDAVLMVDRIGGWEKFTFVHIRDDVYGIRSPHGTYLRAHDDAANGRVDLQTDKHNWDKMTWEQWTVVRAKNGKVALRSTHGKYLRAYPDKKVDQAVDKHNWDVMTWEQFTLVPV